MSALPFYSRLIEFSWIALICLVVISGHVGLVWIVRVPPHLPPVSCHLEGRQMKGYWLVQKLQLD